MHQISVAYSLFVRGLAHVTATQASLTGMLEPIANPIWVFLLLGERPSGYAVAGGIIGSPQSRGTPWRECRQASCPLPIDHDPGSAVANCTDGSFVTLSVVAPYTMADPLLMVMRIF